MMGPPLGPSSSGPLVGRTIEQWFFGWYDPVLDALQPSGLNASSPWWSHNANKQWFMRPVADAPRWAELAAAVGNGSAPAGAASRFFTMSMATGHDSLSRAGDYLLDNGVSVVSHLGGDAPVGGRSPSKTGFGDMSKLPFGFPPGMPASWYFGRLDMSIDPGNGVGLGRVVPLSWDGVAPSLHQHIPAVDYELSPDTLTPCGGAAPNASSEAVIAARKACVYGDYVAGVWNISMQTHAPIFISRGHFYGADPALAASLGPGAAALAPDEKTHNLRASAGCECAPSSSILTRSQRTPLLADGA